MTRYILRRILLIPFALVLIHFLAFAYATVARPIRAARTPYLREQIEIVPLGESYREYIQAILSGDPGELPGARGSLGDALWLASKASLGLLSLALALSVTLGMLLGTQAVRTQPPGVRRLMTPIVSLGLATPSFYVGSLGMLAIVYYLLWKGPGSSSPIPIKGFGWDAHLVMPTLALLLRPTVQIAQVTAGMLAGELSKQYIIAARSFGHTWRNIRWRQAMRNTLAPILLTIAGSFRLMVGELIVVEWLFNWPGLGNMLASTLVPGTLSTSLGATRLFLNPPVVAAIVTIIGALFLLVDLISSISVRILDPRLRPREETEGAGGEL